MIKLSFVNYLFIVVGAFILCSCLLNSVGCKKISITPGEMNWFKHYRNNDTVYFTSAQGEIDTFVVEVNNIQEYNTCNKFELGDNIYGSANVTFYSKDSYPKDSYGFRQKFSISFWKDVNHTVTDTCSKQVEFFELDSRVVNRFDDDTKSKFSAKGIKKEIEVYVYTNHENCYDDTGGDDVMHQYAFSAKYGLVWYRRADSIYYERVW